MRLAYVMAFGLSMCPCSINRTKKPFNPLLGETFEMVDNNKGYKFLSE